MSLLLGSGTARVSALTLPRCHSVLLTSPSPVWAQFSQLSRGPLSNGVSKFPSGSNVLCAFGPHPLLKTSTATPTLSQRLWTGCLVGYSRGCMTVFLRETGRVILGSHLKLWPH